MREVDLVVKTTNLNRIMEHEPADLIATAEAGVTLCEFNAELASRGQWLPLDPPDDGRATLGGVVATGLAGPQRIGYGSPRTFVIGMKVVLPDGTRIKAGGRVVKNVAGYDLCKLFTGSYGTLGIITELTFKLRPLPQASSTILLSGDAENLLIGATALLAANLFPVAVELLSPQFAAESQLSSGDDGVLLIRFAGLSRAVDHQSSVALNLLKEYSRSAEVRAGDDEHVWRDLAAKPFQFQDQAMWRVSIPPSALGPFLNSMKLAGRKVGDTSKMWQASVGEGRVRVIEPAQRSNEELHKSIIALRTQAEGLGGSAVIESLPAGFKGAIDAWGIREGQDSLMKRIKQQFDPMNILSPGRFDAIMA
jgi:FAD/FMN-containing dehydrogenase